MPLRERSHPQFSNSPLEQARVSACATPALEIAWTKAASRVPNEKQNKKNCWMLLNWSLIWWWGFSYIQGGPFRFCNSNGYRVYKYRLPFSYPLLLNDVIEYFTKLNLVLILTHETIIWNHFELNQYSDICYSFIFIKLPFLESNFSENSNFLFFA